MCWWTSACWHLPRTARMTGQYQRLLREYVQEFQLPALPIHFDMVPHVNWFLIFYILCFLWSSKSWHVTSLHEWCVHQEWRVSIIGKSKSLYCLPWQRLCVGRNHKLSLLCPSIGGDCSFIHWLVLWGYISFRIIFSMNFSLAVGNIG